MAVIDVIAPSEEPLTLDLAKKHCRVDGSSQDDLMNENIISARHEVERFTRRRLVSQTVELRLDCFGSRIEIPTAPVQSITSISYLDASGVEQVVDPSAYRLIRSRELVSIIPQSGNVWPAALCEPDSVRVLCVVGYGSAADVPAPFVTAMRLLVGHYNEHREGIIVGTSSSELPLGVKDILMRHVLWV